MKASAVGSRLYGCGGGEKVVWCCGDLRREGLSGVLQRWEVKISPFSMGQIDPTGAGDSLLGCFVAELAHGLPVPDAALLGNFFVCLTVAQTCCRVVLCYWSSFVFPPYLGYFCCVLCGDEFMLQMII